LRFFVLKLTQKRVSKVKPVLPKGFFLLIIPEIILLKTGILFIMRIIAIVNQKGGVGKTTTVLNLGAGLSRLGKRVLMVDMDPQALLTISSGIDLENLKYSVYDASTNGISIQRIIKEVSMNLFLVPSAPILSNIEMEKLEGGESLLKEAFKGFGNLYNYILIDCPPSFGILTLNALSFAREVFIVLQTEYLALKELPILFQSINKVRQIFNPELKVTGVIGCLYDSRRKLDQKVKEDIGVYLKYKYRMFRTIIRKNVSLAECAAFGKDIFRYAPHSYGAQDYLSLAKEVIKAEEKQRIGLQKGPAVQRQKWQLYR
jgi:chromosome partitioning protein